MDMNQETKVTVIDDRLRQEELKLCAAGLLPAPGLSLLLRCLEQWR